MTTYENAPATKMLAVYCACCSRPLVDAKSVETGMGPHCRAKHGYAHECSEEQRGEANRLVHRIAVLQDGEEVQLSIALLFTIGFEKLADRIAKRLGEITLSVEGDRYILKAPYSEQATAAFRGVAGRRWDRERKVNTFPMSSRASLWDALTALYRGKLAKGPKGFFTVGEKAAPAAPVSVPTEHYTANQESIDREEDAREVIDTVGEELPTLVFRTGERFEPIPGSVAATARAMSNLIPGYDWDTWKEDMKDQKLEF